LRPLLYSSVVGGAWYLPAIAGWQSWRGVVPHRLVVVVVGWMLGRVLPLVVVVVAAIYCRTVVVRGKMMTHILTQFLVLILDPGQT